MRYTGGGKDKNECAEGGREGGREGAVRDQYFEMGNDCIFRVVSRGDPLGFLYCCPSLKPSSSILKPHHLSFYPIPIPAHPRPYPPRTMKAGPGTGHDAAPYRLPGPAGWARGEAPGPGRGPGHDHTRARRATHTAANC